jgi:C-terminal processing protease CtpA/Prc
MTSALRMRIPRANRIALASLLCSLAISFSPLAAQQPGPPRKLDSADLDRAHDILRQAYEDLKKNYYDPAYHGVDIEGTYHQYDARLNASQAPGDTFRLIAAYLGQLKDSHTFFEPPVRTNRSTLGYDMEMIGDRCFVTHIRPNTDAARKLHIGDQVLAINGYDARRANFWSMQYFFRVLTRAPGEMLQLQDPAGARRQETIQASIRTGKSVLDLTRANNDFWQLVRDDEKSDYLDRHRYVENEDVFVWKMPTFMTDLTSIQKMFPKVRKHRTLVLDLRNNSGGSEDILKSMIGYLFDHDVKLADRVSRKDKKPMLVKTAGKEAFTGKLIVLVNSESDSASELLARVVQLEKRGTVIGDQSGGKVMESQGFTEKVGTDYVVYYGLSITTANLIMTDGKSLENAGVTPDEVVLPSAQDLSDGKDPVLAHAMQLAGLTIDPAAAGKLFPFEWPDL